MQERQNVAALSRRRGFGLGKVAPFFQHAFDHELAAVAGGFFLQRIVLTVVTASDTRGGR
jgi:hypothetical protein